MNIEQVKHQCMDNFSHQTSQSRKTHRDILKKNNNTMNSLMGHQWMTDSTNSSKKNNTIESKSESDSERNSNSTNSNQNSSKSNSKNRSQSNSIINKSNTMSLLKTNSSNLHLEICLSMSCNQNTMSMRQRNRGSSKSWKGWRRRPRERRRWRNKQRENKLNWHRIVNWELMHYPLFKAEKANFRWFLISYNRRRRKLDKIWWI